MESAQRELLSVLLERLWGAGLISKTTYSGAVDLVHCAMDIPVLLRVPVRLPKEAMELECAQDTQ